MVELLVVETINNDESFRNKIVLSYNSDSIETIIGAYTCEDIIEHEKIAVMEPFDYGTISKVLRYIKEDDGTIEICALSSDGIHYWIYADEVRFKHSHFDEHKVIIKVRAIKRQERGSTEDAGEGIIYEACTRNACFEGYDKDIIFKLNDLRIKTKELFSFGGNMLTFTIECGNGTDNEIDRLERIHKLIYIFYGYDINKFYTNKTCTSITVKKIDFNEYYSQAKHGTDPFCFKGMFSHQFIYWLHQEGIEKVEFTEEKIDKIIEIIQGLRDNRITELARVALLNSARQCADDVCKCVVNKNNLAKYKYDSKAYNIEKLTANEKKWSPIVSFTKSIECKLCDELPSILELRNHNVHNTDGKALKIEDKYIRLLVSIIYLSMLYQKNDNKTFQTIRDNLYRITQYR